MHHDFQKRFQSRRRRASGARFQLRFDARRSSPIASLEPACDDRLSLAVSGSGLQHRPRFMAVLKASAQHRNQKVLLAEDESMIRELIATFLTNLGFTVIEAENGRDSLEQAKKIGAENISLLITDLVMPVMGGLELAAELRKLQPSLRVLFISGYTDDVVILGDEAKLNTAFLKKPFNFETLRHRVETLLAERT